MRNFDAEYLKLYTALCATEPCASSILRARLLATMQHAGKTPTGLAVEMGLDRKTWGRKLKANHGEPRRLAVEDIDAILTHLRLPSTWILRPVLLDGDREVLTSVRSYAVWTSLKADAPDPERVAQAIVRLRAQGLIDHTTNPDMISLTRLGRAALRR